MRVQVAGLVLGWAEGGAGWCEQAEQRLQWKAESLARAAVLSQPVGYRLVAVPQAAPPYLSAWQGALRQIVPLLWHEAW